jgi:anti-anti-sigma regulatory factor
MLRIRESVSETARLTLEGRIVGPWTAELRLACERAMTPGAGIVLDLAGVDFIDRDATRLLGDLRARGARLLNASPFVAELLKGIR